jgi:hypothetical protein
MPPIPIDIRRPTSAALVLVLACLALSACGGSSNTGTSARSASTGTASSPQLKGLARRFEAVRECMQRNGVKLSSTGILGGLPKGVSRAAYTAALKKCGGAKAGGIAGAPAGRAGSPAYRRAVLAFSACLRAQGLAVPAPNTSGEGPIFDSKGLDTTSAKYKAAQSHCAGTLRGLLPTHPAGEPPHSAG